MHEQKALEDVFDDSLLPGGNVDHGCARLDAAVLGVEGGGVAGGALAAHGAEGDGLDRVVGGEYLVGEEGMRGGNKKLRDWGEG